jgi:hypothetical protein
MATRYFTTKPTARYQYITNPKPLQNQTHLTTVSTSIHITSVDDHDPSKPPPPPHPTWLSFNQIHSPSNAHPTLPTHTTNINNPPKLTSPTIFNTHSYALNDAMLLSCEL